MKNDPDFTPARGDHLPLEKDHRRGDHLTRCIPLRANAHAGLGGHFSLYIDSDQGGHLVTPPFIRG
jgi:hypothetical protein